MITHSLRSFPQRISGGGRFLRSSRNLSTASAAEIVETDTSVVAAAQKESHLERNLRPSEVVKELDRHIVGQKDAKRAVAIAMRNRWRRKQLPEDLMKEVTPRNVLLVGPTGCGKTEVARRMAQLNDAPFRTFPCDLILTVCFANPFL